MSAELGARPRYATAAKDFAERSPSARRYATGEIPEHTFHRAGLSVDGSSEYIDALARGDPRVRVHRAPGGAWRDKIAMATAALEAFSRGPEAVLLQLDADELWTPEQLATARDVVDGADEPNCAYFHCHFFVGPGLATATPRGYGHSDSYEWLRAWRADPETVFWASHAPPILVERFNGAWRVLSGETCAPHNETAAKGAVFTHYACDFPPSGSSLDTLFRCTAALVPTPADASSNARRRAAQVYRRPSGALEETKSAWADSCTVGMRASPSFRRLRREPERALVSSTLSVGTSRSARSRSGRGNAFKMPLRVCAAA